MKRVVFAYGLTLATTLAATTLHADPVYQPYGSNLVYGDVSNGYSIMSSITNPAGGAAGYKPGGNKVSLGILSSIGVGYEVGDVDNIYNQIDQKSQEFSNMFASIAASGTADAATVASTVTTTVNDTNDLLNLIESRGYFKVFGSVQWPTMPIQVNSDWLGGSLVFDVNSSIDTHLGLIADQVNINSGTLQNDITNAINNPNVTQTNGDMTFTYDGTNVNFNVANDSTAIVKASLIHELSFAYSRKAWNNATSNLFAGLRLKYYRVELLQEFGRITNNSNSQSMFNNASAQDGVKSSGFGLDIGTMWVTPNYHLGATVTNLNEPSFDYNTVDISTMGYTDTTTINKLQPSAKYTMKRQLKLEGALYTENKHWIIGTAIDANAVKDPMGDKYQWATISAAYLSDHWWLPAARFGYRANQTGSKLGYMTFGFTLFKGLNLDFAYCPNKIQVNNSSKPRSFMANIGLEIAF